MRLVPFALTCLALTTTAFARLGDTLDQAEARYGLEKRPKTPSSTPKLLDGAREVVFEFQGWKIRCALLQATDGNFYVVREDYSKLWSGEIMKAGGVLQIRDFERDLIFQAETGNWTFTTLGPPDTNELSSSTDQLLRTFGVTKVWMRGDGATAHINMSGINVIFDLPQALHYEAELKGIKDQRAREFTSHLVPPENGVISPAPTPPIAPAPIVQQSPLQVALPEAPRQLPPVASSLPPPINTQPAFPINGKAAISSALRSLAPLSTIAFMASVAVFLAKRSSRTSSRKRSARGSIYNSQSSKTSPIPNPRPAPRTAKDLDWEDFEFLVGEIYRRQGFKAELSAGTGADGGIDLTLHRAGERVIVQCKSWNTYKVGPKEIREFFGVLVSEKADRGIFVTTGEFTRDARDFADGKSIEMIDGPAFDQLLRLAANDLNDDLLNVGLWAPVFLAESIVTTPHCPFCKTEMVKREGHNGVFWGCRSYPRCKGKREMRKYS